MKKKYFFILLGFLFINCNSQVEIKSISTKELKVLLSEKNIQLLDVRSSNEIKKGFIKTAIFTNYFDDDFYKQASIKLNKNKSVYLYCRSGNRSAKAAIILKGKGYDVYNILGGFNQWKKEN